MGNRNGNNNKKPNFYGKQEKKMRNNFFSQNVERFGPEYYKNNNFRLEDKDCIRILREITKGHVNVYDYANDILAMVIPLKDYIAKRMNETWIISQCIGEYIQRFNQSGNLVGQPYTECYEKYFNLNVFYNIAMSAISQFEQYPDPGVLVMFANNANKYIIKDLY